MQRLHSCYLKSKNPDRGTQLCVVELNRAATKGQKRFRIQQTQDAQTEQIGAEASSVTLTGWVPTGFVPEGPSFIVTHFLHQNPNAFDITYLCSKK